MTRDAVWFDSRPGFRSSISKLRQKFGREQSYLHNEPSALRPGWGGRDRTSEWRNQNPFDYITISRRIWKKWSKGPPAISMACQLFPNDGVTPLQHPGERERFEMLACRRVSAEAGDTAGRPWKLSAQAKTSACGSDTRDKASNAHPRPRRLRRATESHRAARSGGRRCALSSR